MDDDLITALDWLKDVPKLVVLVEAGLVRVDGVIASTRHSVAVSITVVPVSWRLLIGIDAPDILASDLDSATLLGEFEGVRLQIDEHLLDPLLI